MFLAKAFLDKIVIGEGWGNSKKDAEQEAAKLALMKISKNMNFNTVSLRGTKSRSNLIEK